MVRNIILFFSIINALSYLIMHIDKNNARKNGQRISEASIIAIAAIGGSIGVLIGMYTLRHKTRKLRFTIGVPIILLLQIALILVL